MTEPATPDDRPSTPIGNSEVQSTTAPTLRDPPVAPTDSGPRMGLPSEGQTLGDFRLERLLGSGSFAKVFLARQVSLDRLVALKVSVNCGNEARTLAALEHDHIVRVFSEVVDPARDLRMLCMQYVPGTTLEYIIQELSRAGEGKASIVSARGSGGGGRQILAIVDERASDPAALDLAALRDRELLAGLDSVEAGCWIGARLAEALAHAHGLGVQHRDVKPANIIVNRYGRPLLVDFNVASIVGPKGTSTDPLGGTLVYMSPEHLNAFSRKHRFGPPIDARSDIYSLGVVLYELFARRPPFPSPGAVKGDVLLALIDQRKEGPPWLPVEAGAPAALQRVIARCLATRREERYQTGAELAEALESCRELRRVERDLPRGRLLTRLAFQHPFLVAAVLIPLPQVLGSIVNITYNALRIVTVLSEAQQTAFLKVLLAYNAIAYPLGLFLFFRQVIPVFRTWTRLSQPGPVDESEVTQARQRALNLPLWVIAISCLGWLPGGVVFPLALHLLTRTAPPYREFIFSFTISGLIAMTYSWMAVEFVVVRVLYPGLWLNARDLRKIARGELGREEGRMALIQFLAVLIPLGGAMLLLGAGTDQFNLSFRLLAVALLAVGMAGLGLAILAAGELRRTIAAIVSPTARDTQEASGQSR